MSRRTDRAVRAERYSHQLCRVVMEEDDSQMAEMAEMAEPTARTIPFIYSELSILTGS